jgi:hypothetical protein
MGWSWVVECFIGRLLVVNTKKGFIKQGFIKSNWMVKAHGSPCQQIHQQLEGHSLLCRTVWTDKTLRLGLGAAEEQRG